MFWYFHKTTTLHVWNATMVVGEVRFPSFWLRLSSHSFMMVDAVPSLRKNSYTHYAFWMRAMYLLVRWKALGQERWDNCSSCHPLFVVSLWTLMMMDAKTSGKAMRMLSPQRRTTCHSLVGIMIRPGGRRCFFQKSSIERQSVLNKENGSVSGKH